MRQATPAAGTKVVKLFRNNRSQAIRIPVEFEFPGEQVMIHREGHRLVIEPVPKKPLLDILRSLSPLEEKDEFPHDIDAGLIPLKDVDL